ncbi:hypothetical protein SAMN05421812_101284 [Asanoa hainanensis]|uniref:Outer membrane channel protein CpnT-like N-terminal domain-containing protein n=1 Tax=Asanoa hainanensis TaxID=560556 RepID=A0A239G9Q3_9ACTN|nr:hypothetical protein [Asanoa hainanensis]SNS65675.1 hypothetical protein SAMN05421812_101284 [Asanoa hainanensis]
MGLELPSELVPILGLIGVDWPESDETALYELGQTWIRFGETLGGAVGSSQQAVQTITAESQGQAIEAFSRWWGAEGSPASVLQPGQPAATTLGAALIACAGLVLALKIQVIVQLILLAVQIAQAIATAAVTFGASLAQIPIFRMITKIIVDQLIDMVIQELIGG